VNFDDLHSYNPTNGKWVKIRLHELSEKPPEKRLGNITWVFKGQIYVFGGYSFWTEELRSPCKFSYGGFGNFYDKVTGR
jgi:hypothetical protein